MGIDTTQLALLLVSLAFLITLSWIGWNRYTIKRAERRQAEDVIRQQVRETAQSILDEHSKKISDLIAQNDRGSLRQQNLIDQMAKQMTSFTEQIARLIIQIEQDTTRHSSVEDALRAINERLKEEIESSKH